MAIMIVPSRKRLPHEVPLGLIQKNKFISSPSAMNGAEKINWPDAIFQMQFSKR
jgi:hypothetical protein